MDQVQVKAELAEAQSSVVVSASPAVGGQLLAVPAGAYDVTVQIPQLPIRAKWRVGTSGEWNEFEGGEGFTVSGDDSARVYLAKFAEQSASVTAAVKVRTVGSFTTGSAQVGLQKLDIINTENSAVKIYLGGARESWVAGITNGTTGVIAIELAGLYGLASMVGRMRISISRYTQSDLTIDIAGHWKDSTHEWDEYSATSSGGEINVRFAKDSANQKCYILLGETTTVWPVTRVAIDDVLTNYSSALELGFAISTLSSLSGLTVDALVAADVVVTAVTNPLTRRSKISAGGAAETGLKIVLWGDSDMQNSLQWTALTSGQLTQVGGVATLALAGAHLSNAGQRFWILNTEDTYWYGEHVVSTVVDANTLTFSVDSRAAADVWTTRPSSCVPHFQNGNYYGQANPFLSGMFAAGIVPDDIAFLGANTQSAEQMAWHIERDLTDYTDYDLWVCGTVGANDVIVHNNLPNGLREAKARLMRIKNAGKTILYLGWQPCDTRNASKNTTVVFPDGVTYTTNSVSMATVRFNQEMSQWCAANGIDMISQYEVLVDPADGNGYARSNMLIGDGVHIGKRGGYAMRNRVRDWLLKKYPGYQKALATGLVDRYKSGVYSGGGTVVNPGTRQIFRNPMLSVLGAADANGNVLPESVTLSSSYGMPTIASPAPVGTYGVVARVDGIGNDFFLLWTSAVAAQEQAGSIKFNLAPADIVPGKPISAAVSIKTDTQAEFMGVEAYLNIACSNYTLPFVASQKIAGASGSSDRVLFADAETVDAVFSTPIIDLPADAIVTSAEMIVRTFLKASATGTTATAKVYCGRPSVWCERN